MLQLTTNHSASSYNIPVFLDDDNKPMDYKNGIKELRRIKKWSTADLADQLGVSKRTVENWEQGRMPKPIALKFMATFIK